MIRWLALALLLTGCAGSYYAIHSAMIASRDAYKACLATSSDCARERKIYEADLAAHRAVTAGQPGAVIVAPLPTFAPR